MLGFPTKCVVVVGGAGVKLHAWSHIHFGAAEELLGARFQAEVAGYAWMWRQKREPQLHCQVNLHSHVVLFFFHAFSHALSFCLLVL